MAQIDNLAIEITANTSKAVADIQKLASALSALKNASKGISGANISKVATAMSELKYACSGVSQSAINRVNKLADALERIAGLDSANISKVVSAVNRIKTMPNVSKATVKPDNIFPTSASSTYVPSTRFETYFNPRQTSTAMTPVYTPSPVDMGVGTYREIGNEASASSIKLNRLKDTLKAMGTVAKGNAGKALQTIKKEIGGIGDVAKKVISPLNKLIKALGRIALYRTIRGILKNITQGLKEGIDNLALYSKALNETDSAKANYTMSQLATTALYLKNAFASATMPLIQAFTPAIMKLAQACVYAINILNQLISLLQGKTTFTRAKWYWVDYADQLDKTRKSAKALHHQLAGFDELNNLTAPSGGGGSPELDPTQMFEEAEIDSKILDIVEKIKKVFEEIKKLIPVIGAGIASWAIGTGLAKLLTMLGLLSKNGGLQLAIGLTLMGVGFSLEATGIADLFLNGINIVNFGKIVGGALLASIGSWITGNALGFLLAPIVSAITGLGLTVSASLITAITGGLGTFVAGVGALIAGLWSSIVEGIDWLSAILTVIGTTLTGAGVGAIVGAIVGALGGPIGAGVGALIGVAGGLIMGAITNLVIAIIQHWDEVREATLNAWTAITNFLTQTVPYAIGYCAGWIVRKALEVSNWLTTNIPKMVNSVITFINELPKKIALILAVAMAKFVMWGINLLNWAKAEIPKVKDAIINVFNGKFLEDAGNIGANFLQKMWDGFTSKTSWFGTNILDFFTNLFKKIADALSAGFDAGFGKNDIPSVKGYANGGYVPRGNLFVANERGAEMVGSINGNTAVANNNEITSAIAMATYNAMSKALSENNGSVNIVVEGDGDKMFKVWQKKQREYQKSTGFAY